MPSPRRRSLTPKTAPPVPVPAEAPRPVAVIDMGASAIRLLVAEAAPGQPVRILEEASRGVLLGKDTFTHGRLGAATVEATLKALEGFRRINVKFGADLPLDNFLERRFTVGRFTTEEEIDYTVDLVKRKIAKLRELSPLWEMHKDGIDLDTVVWAAH